MRAPTVFLIAGLVCVIYYPPLAVLLAAWFCIVVNQKR